MDGGGEARAENVAAGPAKAASGRKGDRERERERRRARGDLASGVISHLGAATSAATNAATRLVLTSRARTRRGPRPGF